jgi:hypothetical protein
MVKNFKIMKSSKISKIKEDKPKYDAVEVLVEKEPHQLVDNSFEKLFYNTIDVFAYSRFYEVSLNFKEKNELEYVIFTRSIYENFLENRGFFEEQQSQIYQNVIAIIDEFCSEKFRNFMNICNAGNKSSVDEGINQFINHHKDVVNEIKTECKKENPYKKIECFMKILWERNPEKFQELIDFEINKKELKDSSDMVRLVAGDRRVKPSAIFLNQIKKHSNLEKTSSQNRNQRSFCAIS